MGQTIAHEQQMVFHQEIDPNAVRASLMDKPHLVVFWDVDTYDARSSMAVQIMTQILVESVPPVRVFAISSKGENETPHLFSNPAFGHRILRRLGEPAAEIYGRIARSCLSPDPFGLPNYLPDGASVQKIIIRQSKERRVATEAVNNILVKKKTPSRLAALAAHAVDELLMNAVFDAPVGSDGVPYRAQDSRASDFLLEPREEVTLAIGSSKGYVAISVVDQFGSFKKNSVMKQIQRDYQRQEYQGGDSHASSGGLGIYGILQAELSLLFIAKTNVKTEVVLFFPVVRNMKQFRGAFHFLSFILR